MDLFVFGRRDLIDEAADLELDAVVVDLEWHDKARRQDGADTDISTQTIDDLALARTRTDLPIICRIDAINDDSADQIDRVIDSGADEILIPMVRLPSAVEWALDHVDGRVPIGVMVETTEAIAHARDHAALPIARAYVGLNDLWIERRTNHRFSAFTDGTLDLLAEALSPVPFGVAGLTYPEFGRPLPCSHLINEIVRLGCDFTFLRRSFFAAIEMRPAPDIVGAIRAAIAEAARRTADETESDRLEAWQAIAALAAEPLGMPT